MRRSLLGLVLVAAGSTSAAPPPDPCRDPLNDACRDAIEAAFTAATTSGAWGAVEAREKALQKRCANDGRACFLLGEFLGATDGDSGKRRADLYAAGCELADAPACFAGFRLAATGVLDDKRRKAHGGGHARACALGLGEACDVELALFFAGRSDDALLDKRQAAATACAKGFDRWCFAEALAVARQADGASAEAKRSAARLAARSCAADGAPPSACALADSLFSAACDGDPSACVEAGEALIARQQGKAGLAAFETGCRAGVAASCSAAARALGLGEIAPADPVASGRAHYQACLLGDRGDCGRAARRLQGPCQAGDASACSVRALAMLRGADHATARRDALQALADACRPGDDPEGVCREVGPLADALCGDDGLSCLVASRVLTDPAARLAKGERACALGEGAACGPVAAARWATQPGESLLASSRGCVRGDAVSCAAWALIANWPAALDPGRAEPPPP